MKQSSLYIVITAVILQGCAGTTNINAKGTRALLEGSKPLSLSTEQCPHGLGIVRLYKDTLDGNKTRFNAKLAYSKKPIEGKFNVYNLLNENNDALLKPGERKAVKADIDTEQNSILLKLSDAPIEDDAGAAKKFMVSQEDGGIVTKVNKEISVRYNPAHKYYENWGEVENGALSEVDTGEINKSILRSISTKINGTPIDFPIPETIDGANLEHPLDQKFKEEIGKPLEIKLTPKTDGVEGIVYVQFTNGLKGGKNATYNYIADEPADGVLKVPTAGIAKGEYVMNIFRSEIMPVDIDKKTEGDQNFCMEVGTGIMGRVAFDEPKKEEEKK
ncbi:MAG: hypothetical protein IT286_04025 [Proteobacteria bacterium]|jgi:hypothetical protein|nr:hypothetical protein [Pseudomonadota bacterium]